MTKTDLCRRLLPPRLALALAIAALVAGRAAGAEPAQREVVLREAVSGPVIVTYASVLPAASAPPDGVRAAAGRVVDGIAGRAELSAATFYHEDRAPALLWIRKQMDGRRRRGLPLRLILAGDGAGATEAAETARTLLLHNRDFVIDLLLTVDAVKADRYGSSAAYAAGNALVRGLPGVEASFTAYTAAPAPDGRALLAHINYYQTESTAMHGDAMPRAENHRIADGTGILGHDNAADFALPNLVADLRFAVAQSLRAAARPGGAPR